MSKISLVNLFVYFVVFITQGERHQMMHIYIHVFSLVKKPSDRVINRLQKKEEDERKKKKKKLATFFR